MLEQEIASIIKFVLDYTKELSPYYWSIPANFTIPAVYFPPPEINTGGETFLTYYMDYALYIKFFHRTEQEAYSIGFEIVKTIKAMKNLIPLIQDDGKKINGSWVRVSDPKLKILDSGVAQLNINWRSRRPYEDIEENIQMAQSINFDVFTKSRREISDTYAKSLEKYAVALKSSNK